MPAPLSSVGRIILQMIGIWLYHLIVLQKQQSCFFRWHPPNKVFGFVKNCAQPGIEALGVDRLLGGNAP